MSLVFDTLILCYKWSRGVAESIRFTSSKRPRGLRVFVDSASLWRYFSHRIFGSTDSRYGSLPPENYRFGAVKKVVVWFDVFSEIPFGGYFQVPAG